MSAHHAPDWVPHREGTGIKHDGTFATWLGMISFTFFMGVFVAANVYLRGWAPDKFNVDFGQFADMPEYTTLILLVAGFILLLAGSAFRSNAYKRFQALMILATLAIFGYAISLMWMIVHTYYLGANAWTTHLGIYSCQMILAVVCMVFMFFVGKAFAERNEKGLRTLVPITLSIFLYTVVTGLLIFIVTDVVSIEQFAEWCGTKLNIIDAQK
ncbi:MAG: hypothetical protein WCC10_02485 [Tumebacillaceae bacterium]